MFKSRLKTRNLFRRASSVQDNQPQPSSPSHETPAASPIQTKQVKQSRSFSSLRDRRKKQHQPEKLKKVSDTRTQQHQDAKEPTAEDDAVGRRESLKSIEDINLESSIVSLPTSSHTNPEFIVEEPTPGTPPVGHLPHEQGALQSAEKREPLPVDDVVTLGSARKHSLVSGTDVDIIKESLHDDVHLASQHPSLQRGFTGTPGTTALNTSMLNRKVWVKRPNASATIVLIREDDLVDEAKETILRKYGNSLGRHYDSPDIAIRITTRGQPGERVLNPDEQLCKTLDSFYPGGQSIDEALVVDVPPRRTPRPSPRASHHQTHNTSYYYGAEHESSRPHESGTDYFPIMPPINPGQPSPMLTNTSHESHSHDSRRSHTVHERAMSVLNTGQVPPLPSPGRRTHVSKQHRPNAQRNHTSSPTTLASSVASRSNRPRLDSTASTEKHPQNVSIAPPLPSPQPTEVSKSTAVQASTNPPTPRVSSPRPSKSRKTRQKQKDEAPTTIPGILDTSVPPINVLIVEDNMINMRLLEQFVRRLGVRWQTAVNGREAVTKWRQGGFHLVLMDIQLPIMSGLEATKEIRRLERVNNIGVFSSASSSAPDYLDAPKIIEIDRLDDEGRRLFKSPIIIVALTASNLQSDRHEALAAGCNDFLTKPVNFVWFERKVKEWGCMQALIDFDGWRKWKDFAEANGLKNANDRKQLNTLANKQTTTKGKDKEKEKEKMKSPVTKTAPPLPGSKTPEPDTAESKSPAAEISSKDGVKSPTSDMRDFADRVPGAVVEEELHKGDGSDTVINVTSPGRTTTTTATAA